MVSYDNKLAPGYYIIRYKPYFTESIGRFYSGVWWITGYEEPLEVTEVFLVSDKEILSNFLR